MGEASMKILVMCGAGASSTFIAQRLRRAAEAAGLDWSTVAGGELIIRDHPDADLVLLGPHLADRAAELQPSGSSARFAVLESDVYSDLDGSRTLGWVRTLLRGTA
ncbi:PTS sugar transporter subunit IIB [Leucobacter sp. Psy1]|uniref:PTS sugar transporter subunit IIB n=1 Tax=Leucobacter sp. Psy1 TaxID=2875729 RepID=UPI001CD7B52B|nr:hypothetical protein [Leucobacter sp. Psy1]